MVDDNDLGLVARRRVLEELGYRVTASTVPEQALKLFADQRFDLVITDYRMPRLNGRELIRRLREQSGSVPIILLSGYVDSIGLNEENTGADLVLRKSENEVVQMTRAVGRLLRRTRKPARKPPGSARPPARAAKSGAG